MDIPCLPCQGFQELRAYFDFNHSFSRQLRPLGLKLANHVAMHGFWQVFKTCDLARISNLPVRQITRVNSALTARFVMSPA